LKIGKGNTPITSFNRFHLKFSAFYIALAIAMVFYFKLEILSSIIDIFIGLFLYFGIHYAIFLNFFSLAQRSISSAILILLLENSRSLSEEECMTKYANGKGFSYIKKSRIEDMLNLAWIKGDYQKYFITDRGSKVIRFVRFILNFWGLRQLGK
jgi:hypothetical protein